MTELGKPPCFEWRGGKLYITGPLSQSVLESAMTPMSLEERKTVFDEAAEALADSHYDWDCVSRSRELERQLPPE